MIVRGTAGTDSKLQVIARDASVDFIGTNERIAVPYKIGAPRIALYKSYMDSMDEGWTRFIFEAYGVPFANVLDKDIPAGNLRAKYDVLIIPGELTEADIVQGHRPGSMPPSIRWDWR